MTEENFFNKKQSKTSAFKVPVKKDEKKSSKVVGAATGVAAGAGTVSLILNNKTNKEIYRTNSSLEEKILEYIKDGDLTESELKEIRKNGILKADGKNAIMDRFKDNIYNYLAREENWKDGKFKAVTERQFLQEISDAQKNAIESFGIGERLKFGFTNMIETQGAKTSIKESARALGVSPDIIATSGIIASITAAVIGAGFLGSKIGKSFFKNKKREEMIRKSGEAQVAKQENALKAQQAKVHMGTEFSPSVQTEAVNAR